MAGVRREDFSPQDLPAGSANKANGARGPLSPVSPPPPSFPPKSLGLSSYSCVLCIILLAFQMFVVEMIQQARYGIILATGVLLETQLSLIVQHLCMHGQYEYRKI